MGAHAPGHVPTYSPEPVLTDQLGPMVPLLRNSPNQWIAASGMILRVLVGSGVHGMAVDGTDDRDEMGVCIEPPATVIGLRRFEHYQYRTQPEGVCSGPGDLDLVVYSLRKYARLAAQGNPTILTLLFVPDEHVQYVTDLGRELRDRAALFVSRQAADRFLGYLESQRRGLLGLRSGGTRNQGRADIRARYGYDVKFAAHMVRLGVQGVELMRTGRITLPIPEPHLSYLRAMRRGEIAKEDALDTAHALKQQIRDAAARSALPDEPDRAGIDLWLESAHRRHWGWGGAS